MMDTGRLYGDSLYDLAAEEKLTETLMGQVEMVAEVLKENPEYLTLLSEPSVAKAERLSLIDEAFGEQVHPYLLNFFKILCSEGIVRSFSGCSREFRRRYNEDHNIAEALIVTAVALKEEQREALKARLEKIREQLEKEQSRVLNSSSGASEDTICSLRKEYEEKHTEYAHEILRRITEV